MTQPQSVSPFRCHACNEPVECKVIESQFDDIRSMSRVEPIAPSHRCGVEVCNKITCGDCTDRDCPWLNQGDEG